MKIGIMCHSSFGGSARIATELSIELANRGHRVHLFTRETPFGHWNHNEKVILNQIIPDHICNLHPANLYTDWPDRESELFLTCILEVIDKEGLDLLHFHYALPFAFFAEKIKHQLGKSAPLMVGTLHGTDVTTYGQDPRVQLRIAQILRELNGLTTVSFSYAQLAAKVFGLHTFPKVIPNFVNLSKFLPRCDIYQNKPGSGEMAQKESTNKKRGRIIHISNFRKVKKPQSMAQIFLDIRKKIDAELWLIGDGPEMNEIKSFFKQNANKNEVYYWGLCNDVTPILRQADLLLMSSLSESFCLTALEAMACGIPVLATNVGGLPEVVIHGKTGFLYQIGDHSSAVDFAVKLLTDPVRHKAMRKAAVMQAHKFGHEQIVTIYEDFYHRVLKVGGNYESFQS